MNVSEIRKPTRYSSYVVRACELFATHLDHIVDKRTAGVFDLGVLMDLNPGEALTSLYVKLRHFLEESVDLGKYDRSVIASDEIWCNIIMGAPTDQSEDVINFLSILSSSLHHAVRGMNDLLRSSD